MKFTREFSMAKAIFQNDWQELLAEEMAQPYYRELRAFLIEEYRTRRVYPDMYSIFNALHYTSFADTKVVILGQDPYHGDGQAHGLSFSVQVGIDPPPSLLNIYKEMQDDLGIVPSDHGCLIPWARQGVLPLRTVPPGRAPAAASHAGHGWARSTDTIIRLLGAREKPLAFILWGSPARKKRSLITNPHHLIVESPHPSPLSAHRGFFGSHPFSRVNDFLTRVGETPIDWQLPPAEQIET